MSMIGAALIVVLIALGALHLYWGLGGRWPGHDEESLLLRVSGAKSGRMYGLVACALVALALSLAASVVFVGQGPVEGILAAVFVYGGYAVLIAVFGLRGLAAYITPAFAYARGTPFYDLNRRYYAPLCLLIALGLAVDFPSGLQDAFA